MKKFLFLSLFLIQASSAFAESTQNSMAALLASGQSVTCTYSKTDETPTQQGTIYVAEERLRADVTVTEADGTAMPVHMIREGEWMYTWGGPMGESQGMKMKAAGAAAPGHQGPNMDEQMTMDCQPWTADNSKFQVPSGIEFHELGIGMGIAAPNGAMDMSAIRCAACDQVPPDEQVQCKQVLGCA